jgi:hypothetical protein
MYWQKNHGLIQVWVATIVCVHDIGARSARGAAASTQVTHGGSNLQVQRNLQGVSSLWQYGPVVLACPGH